jgi:signal transduction histidine kinase/CheY-like chemotaxis protein
VVLTDFRIFDRPVDLDTAITYKQKIQLSYDQNFFSFEFATLGFTKPGTSQYAYKLAGFDQDWIYSDTRRYASYTNLDPGQYTFWLKASNSDGIWGSSKQMITVEIIPPFWMTNLFKVGLMLVVVLLGFWVIRYREKTLRLSNLTLERKVQERTRELEKTAEKLRRKSEEAQKANLAKSHFLAGISHELRTPLNAILGFGQLLKRSSNLTSKQAEYVNTMHRSGEHLLSMINDVLDISKIEAGRMDIKKESIDLPQLVADISDMFRLQCNEKALSFSLTIDDDVPTYVFSDPGKIRQILVNLIGNAVKYTSTGSISVSVQIDPHISPTLSTNDDQNKVDPDTTFQQVKFTISDTGPGIPSDQLDSIFEPFKQVTDNFSDGTGLGLAITYRLITLLDGVIDVDSRLKQGSRFTVSIPMQVLGYAQSEETQSDEVVAIKNATEFEVLVVDDVEYNLTFLSALLGKIGMSCLEARDGSEAIQSYKKHQPDLILMDLRMPNVSGQEAMEAIRSIEADSNQHTPIIAVTASVFKESRGQLIESGFDEFISKPFSEKELFEIIEKTTPITFIRQAVTQQESVPSLSDQQTKPKQMAQAIQNLPSDLREQVIEAIELMDWERLAELNQSSVLSSTLSTYLDHIIQEQDYSKLLSLNEWVNPS